MRCEPGPDPVPLRPAAAVVAAENVSEAVAVVDEAVSELVASSHTNRLRNTARNRHNEKLL